MSNEPIFDRIRREKALAGIRYEELQKPFMAPVGVFGTEFDRLAALPKRVPQETTQKVTSWIDPPEEDEVVKEILTEISEKREAVKLEVEIHPQEAEEEHKDGMYGFVQDRIKEFGRKHPNAVNVTVSVIPNESFLSEMVKVSVVGYEAPGLQLDSSVREWLQEDADREDTDKANERQATWLGETLKKPIDSNTADLLYRKSGGKIDIRRNAINQRVQENRQMILHEVMQFEPKTDEVPSELVARQLEMYRAAMELDSRTIVTTHANPDEPITYEDMVRIANKTMAENQPVLQKDQPRMLEMILDDEDEDPDEE